MIPIRDDIQEFFGEITDELVHHLDRRKLYCVVCENNIFQYVNYFYDMYFNDGDPFKFYCPCCGTSHNFIYKDSKIVYCEQEGRPVIY